MKYFNRLKDKCSWAVENFRQNPLDNLAVIIPVLAGITAIIGVVVAYILFIVNRGYAEQIDVIKLHGIDGISEAFTYGTTYIIYGNIVGNIIKLFLGVEIIVMLVAYFIKESKAKKILMIIDLVLLVCWCGIAILLDAIFTRKIELTKEQENKILEALDIIKMQSTRQIFDMLTVLVVVIIVLFIVLVLISKSRWMLGYAVKATLFSFVGLPLILLFLENVIPMIAGIVALSFLCVVILIIFMSVVSGEETSGNSSPSDSSATSPSNFYSSPKSKEKKKEHEKNCEYIELGFLGFKIYRVHGVMHDYVERDNGVATAEICSLDDLRKGRFHIYDKATGKEIRENEIPWRHK